MPGKHIRRLIATSLAIGSGSAFALTNALAFFPQVGARSPATIVGLVCVLGGLALRSRTSGGQIFARGAIWSSAVFQLLFIHIMSYDSPGAAPQGLIITTAASVIAACVSLHLAARPDRVSSSRFQPVAHLGTLTAALVLAVADTLSLFLWGSLAAQGGAVDIASALLGGGVLMGVGVYGLLRMRTWALLLNLCSNILIASVAATRTIDVGPLALVLMTTAGLQLLVAMPIVISIVRPELRAPRWLHALASWIPATSLLVLATLAVQPLLGKSVLIQVALWAGY